MNPVSHVLNKLFKDNKQPLSDTYRLKLLSQAWPQLLNEEVFSGSLPTKYHKGQLFIYLTSASQLQDVIFLRRQIIKRVNHFFKTNWVIEIRLTLEKPPLV